MFNCSMNQILKLWSELESCYYNNNGFGGNVAEIYAYTLREDSPMNNHLRNVTSDGGLNSEDVRQENLEVGLTLVKLCQKFEKDKGCKVFIDDIGAFSEKIREFSFDHRVHVSVIKEG